MGSLRSAAKSINHEGQVESCLACTEPVLGHPYPYTGERRQPGPLTVGCAHVNVKQRVNVYKQCRRTERQWWNSERRNDETKAIDAIFIGFCNDSASVGNNNLIVYDSI